VSGPPSIVLTGFMGTGKSTVGRIVAERLGRDFVDTDGLIASRYGPIPAIFEHDGEVGFRRHERTVAAELAERGGLVIAGGGGMLLDEEAAAALEGAGVVICLVAEPSEILARVAADGADRPLLGGPDPAGRIAHLLEERAAVYGRYPQVDTTGRTPEEVADAVIVAAGDAAVGQTDGP
jgi:shikimate kinase